MSTKFTTGSNTVDGIFIVKFGQNFFLYGYQHERFKMFLRRCAS